MKGKAYSISISGKNQELIEYLNGLTKKDLLSKVFTEVMDRHRLNEREQIEYDISVLEKQIEDKKKLLDEMEPLNMKAINEQTGKIESFDRMSFKMLINNLRMKNKDKEADKKIDDAIESNWITKEDGRTIYGRGN
jgi:hypothetical protein